MDVIVEYLEFGSKFREAFFGRGRKRPYKSVNEIENQFREVFDQLVTYMENVIGLEDSSTNAAYKKPLTIALLSINSFVALAKQILNSRKDSDGKKHGWLHGNNLGQSQLEGLFGEVFQVILHSYFKS